MNHAQAITLKYSADLLKRAARDYSLQKIGIRWPVVTVLMFAYLVYLAQSGERPWLVGMVGWAVLVSSTMIVAAYLVPRWNTLRRFRAMRSRTATIELLGDSFRLSANPGSSELRLSNVEKVWTRDDYLIIDLGPGQFLTLPMESLSDLDRATLTEYFAL